jgi:shikimate dehydrogenase
VNLETARRCAVLGRPISHSLSPALHRAAYNAVGIDWSYDAVEVGSDALAGFLDGLDASWRGLSLTMPLKRVAVPLLDELTDRASQARAANTVILEDGRRIGHNTDIPGAVRAIEDRHGGPLETAIVLGGGATASSVLLALADLGCRHVTLVVREENRARETVEAAGRHPQPPEVDVRLLGATPGPADILVSTIPADAQTPEVVALAETIPVLFDVVYDPWPTPLASFALREGRILVGGLDLLVHQAVLQFNLMTGIDEAPYGVMRSAGEQELQRRSRVVRSLWGQSTTTT